MFEPINSGYIFVLVVIMILPAIALAASLFVRRYVQALR
jgi:hypothetical protein